MVLLQMDEMMYAERKSGTIEINFGVEVYLAYRIRLVNIPHCSGSLDDPAP